MIICPDYADSFLPLPEDLVVTLSDSRDLVMNLLDNLVNYFQNAQGPKTHETCFVAAIQAAANINKHLGGRILLFQLSNTAIRHPMLEVKALSPTDVPAKFGSSNTYF
jgi:protein transport protein SEC24